MPRPGSKPERGTDFARKIYSLPSLLFGGFCCPSLLPGYPGMVGWAHVESYHAILVAAMRDAEFENRQELVEWRETFLAFYNYRRVHSSVVKLPPMTFLDQWERGNIKLVPHLKIKRKARFLLTVPRHTVKRVNQQAMRA